MNISVKFNYTQKFLGHAGTLYLNHSTHYVIPAAVTCFLTQLPIAILRHQTSDILSAVILILCALLTLGIQRNNVQLTLNRAFRPDKDYPAEVKIDDKTVRFSVLNGFGSSIHSDSLRLTDITDFTKDGTMCLLIDDRDLIAVPVKDIPKEDMMTLVTTCRKAAGEATAQWTAGIYGVLSMILWIYAAFNLVSLIDMLF